MSLILEALKRSENERRKQAESVTDTLYVQVRPRHRSRWPVVLVALLLMNLGILLFLWWRGPGAPPETAGTPSPAAIIAAAREHDAPPTTATTGEPTPHVARRVLRPLAQELGNARVVTPSLPPTTPPPEERLAATPPAIPPRSTRPLDEIDTATLQRLQQYEINIIVYSDDPARRYALIDMKKLREGDRLPGSTLRIEEIAPGALIIDTGHGLVRHTGTP